MAFASPVSLRFASHSLRTAMAISSNHKRTHSRTSFASNSFECLASDVSISSSQLKNCTVPSREIPDGGQKIAAPAHVRRIWEPSAAGLDCASELASVATVMSYNVLAQSYVSSTIFSATHRPFLRAPYRRQKLVEDIRRLTTLHNVDILCLQELEADEYVRIAAELLEFDGGCYKQRTAVGVRHKRDGCGVYWRKSKFSQVNAFNDTGHIVDEHVEFNSISEDPVLSQVCDAKKEIVRNCVGALVRLKDRISGTKLIVGSVHVFWDPSFPKLKLAQAGLFRRAAFTSAQSFETNNVVLAGDWNSLPGSVVYAFMTDEEDTSQHEEVRDCGSEVRDEVMRKSDWDFGLSSTYDHSVDDEVSCPSTSDAPLTTFTPKFSGALDHIFVSSNLKNLVLGSLSLPSSTDFTIAGIEALPNGTHTSDHLPVISRIALE